MNSDCELCEPAAVLAENGLAYARLDSNSLAPGHVIVVPRRHVADFFGGIRCVLKSGQRP